MLLMSFATVCVADKVEMGTQTEEPAALDQPAELPEGKKAASEEMSAEEGDTPEDKKEAEKEEKARAKQLKEQVKFEGKKASTLNKLMTKHRKISEYYLDEAEKVSPGHTKAIKSQINLNETAFILNLKKLESATKKSELTKLNEIINKSLKEHEKKLQGMLSLAKTLTKEPLGFSKEVAEIQKQLQKDKNKEETEKEKKELKKQKKEVAEIKKRLKEGAEEEQKLLEERLNVAEVKSKIERAERLIKSTNKITDEINRYGTVFSKHRAKNLSWTVGLKKKLSEAWRKVNLAGYLWKTVSEQDLKAKVIEYDETLKKNLAELEELSKELPKEFERLKEEQELIKAEYKDATEQLQTLREMKPSEISDISREKRIFEQKLKQKRMSQNDIKTKALLKRSQKISRTIEPTIKKIKPALKQAQPLIASLTLAVVNEVKKDIDEKVTEAVLKAKQAADYEKTLTRDVVSGLETLKLWSAEAWSVKRSARVKAIQKLDKHRSDLEQYYKDLDDPIKEIEQSLEEMKNLAEEMPDSVSKKSLTDESKRLEAKLKTIKKKRILVEDALTKVKAKKRYVELFAGRGDDIPAPEGEDGTQEGMPAGVISVAEETNRKLTTNKIRESEVGAFLRDLESIKTVMLRSFPSTSPKDLQGIAKSIELLLTRIVNQRITFDAIPQARQTAIKRITHIFLQTLKDQYRPQYTQAKSSLQTKTPAIYEDLRRLENNWLGPELSLTDIQLYNRIAGLTTTNLAATLTNNFAQEINNSIINLSTDRKKKFMIEVLLTQLVSLRNRLGVPGFPAPTRPIIRDKFMRDLLLAEPTVFYAALAYPTKAEVVRVCRSVNSGLRSLNYAKIMNKTRKLTNRNDINAEFTTDISSLLSDQGQNAITNKNSQKIALKYLLERFLQYLYVENPNPTINIPAANRNGIRDVLKELLCTNKFNWAKKRFNDDQTAKTRLKLLLLQCEVDTTGGHLLPFAPTDNEKTVIKKLITLPDNDIAATANQINIATPNSVGHDFVNIVGTNALGVVMADQALKRAFLSRYAVLRIFEIAEANTTAIGAVAIPVLIPNSPRLYVQPDAIKTIIASFLTAVAISDISQFDYNERAARYALLCASTAVGGVVTQIAGQNIPNALRNIGSTVFATIHKLTSAQINNNAYMDGLFTQINTLAAGHNLHITRALGSLLHRLIDLYYNPATNTLEYPSNTFKNRVNLLLQALEGGNLPSGAGAPGFLIAHAQDCRLNAQGSLNVAGTPGDAPDFNRGGLGRITQANQYARVQTLYASIPRVCPI